MCCNNQFYQRRICGCNACNRYPFLFGNGYAQNPFTVANATTPINGYAQNPFSLANGTANFGGYNQGRNGYGARICIIEVPAFRLANGLYNFCNF